MLNKIIMNPNNIIKFQIKSNNHIDSITGVRKLESFIHNLQLVDKSDEAILNEHNLVGMNLVDTIQRYTEENNLVFAEQVEIPLEYLITRHELQQYHDSLSALPTIVKNINVYKPYQLQNPINPLYKSRKIENKSALEILRNFLLKLGL